MTSGDPCATCAFGKSGGAADEANNRLKGMICALGGIPFFCHHGRNGKEYAWRDGQLGVMELPPNERKVCGGWRRTVAMLAKRGHFRWTKVLADNAALRRYQQSLGSDACRALDDFLGETDPEAKAKANRDLRMNLEALKGDGVPNVRD